MGYTTVKQSSEFYMVERKSEFIGYCAPVTTEEEKQAKEIFRFEGFFPITVDKAGILCYNKYLV